MTIEPMKIDLRALCAAVQSDMNWDGMSDGMKHESAKLLADVVMRSLPDNGQEVQLEKT